MIDLKVKFVFERSLEFLFTHTELSKNTQKKEIPI